MRNYLHYNGLHLKESTQTVIIPTRSFLRMPLLSPEFKEYLLQKIGLTEDRELNKELALLKIEKEPKIMERIANWVASEALYRVQMAFQTSGFGKWAPIIQYTKNHRKGSVNNAPLDNTGQLRDSITVEVKKVN